MKGYCFSFLVFFFYSQFVYGADKYWVGGAGAAWATTSSWSLTSGGAGGAGISSADRAIFDGNATVTMITGQIVGGIWVTNNATVTMSNGSTLTNFNVSVSGTGFIIDAGATLNYGCHSNTSNDFNLITNADISGTLNFNGSSGTITPRIDINSGGYRLAIKNGGKLIQGINSLNFASSSTRPNGLILESGSIFETYRASGCAFLDGVYDANSTIKLLGVYSGPTFLYNGFPSIELGNVEYNPSNQTANVNITTPGGTLVTPYNIKGYLRILNSNGFDVRFCSGSNSFLQINGDLQVATGAVFSLTGGVGIGNAFVNGNIDISGTLTESGSANRCCLYMNGIAPQTISQSGTINNDVSFKFNNAAGITMLSNITLPSTANSNDTLANGLINANGFTFTIGNNAATALVGGSTTCYYYGGYLRRAISTLSNAYLFPLGNGINYKPAVIQFNTPPTVGGSLTANFSTIAPNFPNPSALIEPVGPINNISVASMQGSWFFEKDASLTGGDYTGFFTCNGPSDIIDYTKIVLIKRPSTGGDWTLDGTHITTTGSNTAAILGRTGMTGFSEFGIGGELGVSLPVTLINTFNANITGATNTVYWTTATEVNNRKFIVERSTNGSNFIAIGDVATRAINGNSSTALQYSFVDANPVQGKAFYRLQMVDNGGRTTYSPIVTLRRGGGKLEIVDVRPNPTTGNLYFNLLGVNNNSQFTLTLRTVDGKAILVKNNFTSLGAGVIDMSKLANGMYILEAVDVRNDEKAVFKVMKQ